MGRPKKPLESHAATEAVAMYVKGHSLNDISVKFHVPTKTLSRRLQEHGVKMRGRGGDRTPIHVEKWSGKKHGNWRGGRFCHKASGYWLVHRPNHPHHVSGHILEHRAVLEDHLRENDPKSPALGEDGFLRKDYCVHHRDGNKANNGLENLEAMPRNKHHSWIHYKDQIVSLLAENERLKSLLLANGIPVK